MNKFNNFGSASKPKDFWDDDFGDDLILEVTQASEALNQAADVQPSKSTSLDAAAASTSKDVLASKANGFEDSCFGIMDDDVMFDNIITSTAITTPNAICKNESDQVNNELVNIKLEKDNLKAELLDLQNKFEATVGENAVLRSTLNDLKEQMHSLKLQTIVDTETKRQEHQSQMQKLSKNVEAKNTELRLKLLQCSLVKSNANSTPNLTQADQQYSGNKRKLNPLHEENYPKCKSRKVPGMSKHLMCIYNLDLHISEMNLNNEWYYVEKSKSIIDNGITDVKRLSPITTTGSFNVLQKELKRVSLLLTLSQNNSPTFAEKEKLIGACLNSMYITISEFYVYMKNTELNAKSKRSAENTQIQQPQILDECKHGTKYKCGKETNSLDHSTALHYEDRIICFREYLNILSNLCKQETLGPALVDNILKKKVEQKYVLELVVELISTTSLNRNHKQHDILEAIACWLRNMLQQISIMNKIMEKPELTQVINILKHLITAVSSYSISIIYELTLCLQYCLRLPEALTLLCPNNRASEKSQEHINHCYLVTYANLMISSFSFSSHNEQFDELETMSRISLNHLQFIYFCFVETNKFIGPLTPVIDESSHDKLLQSNSNLKLQINCECYISLCLSVITLIHKLLKVWLNSPQNSHFKSLVSRVAYFGIHIVHLVFCAHYVTCLLRESRLNTKYQLTLICKWLLQNSATLKLGKLNVDLLKKIQKSHALPTEMINERNQSNMKEDLLEWQRLSGDQIPSDILNNIESAPPSDLHMFEEAAMNSNLHFDILKHLIKDSAML